MSVWLGRPMPGDLPDHLKLSSNSSHITCMIIHSSFHGYIRTCQLHVGIFFILYFPFIIEVSLDVCPLSMKYHFYPCHELLVYLCKYVILIMLMLDSACLALLWENINNGTLNTSGCNATMIDSYACGCCL